MTRARAMDVAPVRMDLPDPGLGRGWEASVLMGITLLLLAFGLVTLYSASMFVAHRLGEADHFFVARQTAGGALGLVLMVAVARIPYGFWRRAAWPLLALSLAALLVLVLPGTEAIAPEWNGSRRWLRLGVTVQPSEFAKLTVIVWTAMMAVRKRDQFRSLGRGVAPFLTVWGLLLLPIVLQPDLSTALLVGLLGAIILFAAGCRVAHFVFLGAAASPVLLFLLTADYRRARISSYLQQLADPLAGSPEGSGYQFYQAMVALGSGGVAGQGFGRGWQKFGFLPEPHNDFIFSMVGEEWGFVGVSALVLLYLALTLVGFRVARRAPDVFGQLLATGCASLVALQAFLHMGVGVGLLPTTGLALPLVSYGRSNLLVTLIALGLLMAVARETDADWRPGVREAGRAPDLARRDRHVRRPGPVPGGRRA
ncbi:MAG: putative peptidoglycan glycosyltransferase FtsW [Longimicrobiales bacterium]|nr:putative peptidoglycan glycosyltransferase FtsW [Longimicrobiales bacterium]